MPPNFVNRTIWTGDNLPIIRGLNSESVDLVYLDPPFNSNKDYAAPVGSEAAGAAFKDTWTLSDLDVAWAGYIADEHPAVAYLLSGAGMAHSKGMQSYLTMMAIRLLELHRVLKPTGSIYLHCDPTASHYLKQLLDAIFGHRNLLNEIVWHYRTSSGSPNKWLHRNHDTIFRYAASKPGLVTWNHPREPWLESTLRKWQRDEDGRIYRTQNKFGKRYYIDPDGKLMDDVWEITFSSRTRERIGYPTQKPLVLLERIIEASSEPGDVVLDPFAGCATACVAAEKLDRQWVGIDLSSKAAELVNERLRSEMGDLFHYAFVTSREDVPQRTDIDSLKNYRTHKHVIYGEQEGHCAGCMVHFEFRNLTVDHRVPRKRGGTGHKDNLQLLCGHCNSVKGDRPMAYLLAQLTDTAVLTG